MPALAFGGWIAAATLILVANSATMAGAAATGVVSIATDALPRWLGWLSLLLALGFLIPYLSFVFWVPFGLGCFAVSVLLYLRPAEEAIRTTTAAV